jgi:hypothetical protein
MLAAVIVMQDFTATLSVIIVLTVPSTFEEPLASPPYAISPPQQPSVQQAAVILKWLSIVIPLVP